MRVNRIEFATALARLDLSVNQLAAISGLFRNTISSVKNGKSCSQVTINKLVDILGTDIIKDTAATVNQSVRSSESNK